MLNSKGDQIDKTQVMAMMSVMCSIIRFLSRNHERQPFITHRFQVSEVTGFRRNATLFDFTDKTFKQWQTHTRVNNC